MALCAFVESTKHPGYIICVRGCGTRLPKAAVHGVTQIYAECAKTKPTKPVPDEGPGTELALLIKELGYDDSLCSGCATEAGHMNVIGARRCRKQIDSIVEKIESSAKIQSWWSLARAGVKAASMGIFSIRQLVERAIDNAEAKAKKNRLLLASADQPEASKEKGS